MAYKKRVIQRSESESDGSGDDQPPVAKRPKADDTPSTTSGAPAAGSPDVEMPDSSLQAIIPPKKVAAPAPASDDDTPLAQKPRVEAKSNGKASTSTNGHPASNGAKKEKKKPLVMREESSDDDTPLAQKAAPKVFKAVVKPAKKEKMKAKKPDTESEAEDPASDSEDDSDVPLKAKAAAKKQKAVEKAKPAAKPAKAKTVTKPKKEESATPAKLVQAKKETKGKGKGKVVVKVGDEAGEDDEDAGSDTSQPHRWWDNQDAESGTKWTTLEHNGVMFPPEYEPHGVKMKYDGREVELDGEAEEVASFFAAIVATDYPKNPVFCKNFFDSWLIVLKAHPPLNGIKIKKFELCDFNPIFEHLEGIKQVKKSMTSAEKKLIKAARDLEEESYKTCLLDGRKEKVGNFRVEPPGLFRGRGLHPKTGLLKTRLSAEDITINIGKGVKVPAPPAGHAWRAVVHDDQVTWLATWHENINNAVKYVFLAPGSSLKGQSDFKKFEKARALKDHVDKIRTDYTEDFKSNEMAIRQRATAIYLIDRFALRNGNEKGEDSADTVGCCSLRFEHVTLAPPTTVTFDFLGKDSIRYVNDVEVEPAVFKNLKIFKKAPKAEGDLLFDRLNTSMVNKYLTGYMDGLTAKVFRTYNASWVFAEQLASTPKDATLAEKLLHYTRANRMVAVLCNHQKSVSKGHSVAMDKLNDRLLALKFQRKKFRAQLFNTLGNKRKYKMHLEDESDLEDDWIEGHEVQLVVLERDKITKKFEKENKKLEEAGEKQLSASELKDRLKAADVLETRLIKEARAGWVASSKLSDEKIAAAIVKLDERIALQKVNATDKDEGKEISLGTSVTNYLDPRLTFAWCKKHEVPVTKMLSKTLIEKFTWASEVEEDFSW